MNARKDAVYVGNQQPSTYIAEVDMVKVQRPELSLVGSKAALEKPRYHVSDMKIWSDLGRNIKRASDAGARNIMQNIPNRGWEEDKAIRRLFIPHDPLTQSLMELDYSQQELRIACDLSGDPVMLDCFTNDIDIHKRTAADVMECSIDAVTKSQRTAAKPINFGTIFNMTAVGLQRNAKQEYKIEMTLEEAERWRTKFFRLYSGYRAFMLKEIAQSRKRGCAFVYWCGKPYARRWIPDIGSRNGKHSSHAERVAINTPIQGGASLYTLKSLIKLYDMCRNKKLPGVISIVHTIHDSIIAVVDKFVVEEAFDSMARVMVSFPTIRVPLEVEGKAGSSLADMQVVGILKGKVS